METVRNIFTVDSHTAGEPTRVVVGGFPKLCGGSVAEKKAYLEKNYDYLRTFLMKEPRGHENMFGSVITEPADKDAALGVIFMDTGGYLNMCGHGSIGTSKVAMETGIVEKKSPFTKFKMEAPAGLIQVKAAVDEDGVVHDISFLNQPAFVYKEGVDVHVDGCDSKADICFGGNFFALMSAEDLGIDISMKNIDKFLTLGREIRDYVNSNYDIVHPLKPYINTVDLVEFYQPLKTGEKGYKNVVIFGENQFDRSPCGTGTSAKLALLCRHGEIELGDEIISESILGSRFKGKAMEKTKVDNYEGIIPRISGQAFITGYNNLVLEPQDIFQSGIEFR